LVKDSFLVWLVLEQGLHVINELVQGILYGGHDAPFAVGVADAVLCGLLLPASFCYLRILHYGYGIR
jgi:hypothetical protein